MTRKHKRCHGITGSGTRCKKNATDGAFCKQHPAESVGLVTKLGFADLMGFGPSQTSNLLSEGVIEETDDGYIAYREAAEAYRAQRDPSVPANRQGRPSEAVASEEAIEVEAEKVAGLPDDRTSWGPGEWNLFHKVQRALKEEAVRAQKQMERRLMEEQLVDVDEVRLDVADIFSTLQQRVLTLPNRVANRVAAADSKRDVLDILNDEVRSILNDAADDVEDLFDCAPVKAE